MTLKTNWDMKQKDRRDGEPAELDIRKCLETASTIAVHVTKEIYKARPRSVREGLVMITLAVGRVIHVLGSLMGVDPKVLCSDFCGALTKYFEMGGEYMVDDVIEKYRSRQGN